MHASQQPIGSRGFAHALLAMAAMLIGAIAHAQLVVVNESFMGTSAPGWILGGSGYMPILTANSGIDPVGSGWLRLTSSAGQQSTYAYDSTAFAATSGGVGTTIAVKFNYASYNGSGADGITFFLADASKTFSVGAYGGSLGYAQKTLAGGGEADIAGMNGGYIGLGIDEFGNYANATEGRIGGIGSAANAVSVRGPGNGFNGYEYLGGTGALATQLAFPNSTTRPTGVNLRTFEIIITATNQLTVYMGTGGGPMSALYSIDLSGYARPDNLIMGFTGSTGGLTDIHEVQGLTLTSMAARLWTNGGGTSTWGSSTNWNGTSGQIPINGADILLDNTYVSSAQNINVNQNRIIRSLQIDAPFAYTLNNGSLQIDDRDVNGNHVLGPSGIFVSQTHGSADQTINSPITLANAIEIKNGSAGTLTLNGTVANGFGITFEGPGATEVTGAISGSGAITKNDGGSVTLSGNNSYTGGTTLNAGTLIANSSTALGGGTLPLLLYGGTLASTNGTTINRTLTLLGDAGLSNITTSGTLTNSGANRTLTLNNATQSGAVSLSNNNTARTLTVAVASGESTISGIIQNGGNKAGNLTKTGGGILTLSGANTYTGTTTINAGALRLGNNDRLPGNPLVLAGGTLDLNNFSDKVGTLTFSNGGAIDFGTGTNGNTFVFGTLSTSSSGILTIRNWDSAADAFASTQAGISTTLLNSIYFAGYGSGSIEAGSTTDTGNGEGFAYRITPNSAFTTWNGANGSSNYWNATGPSNWNGGGVPSTSTASTQKLAFTGTTRLGPVMDQNYYANSLKFDTSAGAFTINQNAFTLTLQGNVPSIIQQSANNQIVTNGTLTFAAGTNGVIDVSGAGSLTLSSALNGSGAINKLSNGTLILTGANTGYSGAIDVTAGTLQVSGNNSALGTGTTNVDAGATLRIADGRTLANTITISGTGSNGQGALDAAAGAGNTATLSTALTLAGNSTVQVESGSLALAGVNATNRDLTLTGAGNTSITGAIAIGAGAVTLNGTGITTFSGAANTFTGQTTVNSGTLNLSKAAGTISIAGGLTINGGTVNETAGNQLATSAVLTANGGTFALLNGSSNTLNQVNTFDGSILSLSSGSILTINGTGVSTINGTISGAGVLTTDGTGSVVLGTTNTYSGGTNIGSVTTAMASGSLGSGSVTIANGGNLQIQNGITIANAMSLNSTGTTANDGAIENVSGTNTVSGALTLAGSSRIQSDAGTMVISGPVNAGANTLTIGGLGDATVSGVISGTGGLIKNGSGNLTLSGANTLSGTTRIDAGRLTLGASNTMANTATLALNGGTFAIGGSFNDTIGSLTLLANSTIDYGKNTSAITFTNATRTAGVLTIDNWVGDFSGGGISQLFFTNAPTNFATTTDIVFTGYGTGYTRLASGEIVPMTGTVYTWQASGAGGWATNGNWTPAPVTLGPDGLAVSVIFGNAITTASTVTVSGTKRVGYMVFNSANKYTISGGILNLDVSGGRAQINVSNTSGGQISSALTLADTLSINQNSTGAFTISGGITNSSGTNSLIVTGSGNTTLSGVIGIGAGSVTKNGTGTLTLSAANTYSGGTLLNSGTVAVSTDPNLGTGAVTFDGGTLEATGGFTLGATRTFTVNGGGGTLQTDNTSNLIYNGVLTGTGSIVKTGTGMFTTGGGSANTNTGALTINAGTWEIAKTASVSAIDDSATVTIANGGTLRFNSTNAAYSGEIIGSLSGAAGSVVDNAGANPLLLTIGANGASSTFAGTITDSGAGALSLSKTGAGTLTLSGTNSYVGTTTISAGAIQIGDGGTTGTLGTGNVVNNASLIFNRSDSATVGNTISGTGTLTQAGGGTTIFTATNTYSGSTTINAGTLQLGAGGTTGSINTAAIVDNGTLAINRSNAYALSNTISGTGSVSNLGTGTTTISGTNSYSGGTTVLAGTVRATNASALGTGNLTIAGGATVQLATDAGSTFGHNTTITGTGAATLTVDRLTAGAGITQTLGTLTMGGQQLNIRSGTNVSTNTSYGVTFGATTLTGATTFDVANNGSGTGVLTLGTVTGATDLTKSGAGTLSFSSSLTLTNLTLSGGILALGGDGMTLNVTNQFHITGNTTLDFGSGSLGTILNANNFVIDAGVTLTIRNWNNGTDFFFAQNWSGATTDTRGQGSQLQVIFEGYSNTQTGWQSYDHQITPVPEPRTYGALLLGGCLAFLGWRRYRRPAGAAPAAHPAH
jgi:autotransporter-associated beta strand protein